ncbi:MAG: hypothetical protein VXB01_04125, partial [Opitutae bacterium]
LNNNYGAATSGAMRHFRNGNRSAGRADPEVAHAWQEFLEGPLGNYRNLRRLFDKEGHEIYRDLPTRGAKAMFRLAAYKSWENNYFPINIVMEDDSMKRHMKLLGVRGAVKGFLSENEKTWSGTFNRDLVSSEYGVTSKSLPRKRRTSKKGEQQLLDFEETPKSEDPKDLQPDEEVPAVLTSDDELFAPVEKVLNFKVSRAGSNYSFDSSDGIRVNIELVA